MRYKTLYYNVEPIAKRLPDDCLKLIIQYASEKSKYENWFQTMLKNIEITNQKTHEFHSVSVQIKMKNKTKYVIQTVEYCGTRYCYLFHSHKIVIFAYCQLDLKRTVHNYVYISKTGQYCDFDVKEKQLQVLGQLIQNRYISLNKLKKLKKLNKLNK